MSDLEKYSDDELYAELNRRQLKSDDIKVKTLNIRGFTIANFIVVCYSCYGGEDIRYSFHFKKSKERLNYSKPVISFRYPTDFWRLTECVYYEQEELEYEEWNEFIPNFLAESMENCYESRLPKAEVLKKLESLGFETYEMTEIQD